MKRLKVVLDSKQIDEKNFLFLNNLNRKIEKWNKNNRKKIITCNEIMTSKIENKKKVNKLWLIKFKERINNEESRFNAR